MSLAVPRETIDIEHMIWKGRVPCTPAGRTMRTGTPRWGDPFHLIRGGPKRAVFRQFGSTKTFQVEPNEFRKVFCTEKTFYTGQNSSDEKEIRDLRGLYRRHFVDESRKRP